MAESIGAVNVVFSADTHQFRQDIAAGGKAVENFSASAKRAAAGVSGSMGANNTYSATFGKLGEQVKGASASVAGFSQAVAAMGAKVSPAVKGIGTAFASLLAGGVTPLGLAIGAATTAIAAFAQHSSSAAADTDKLTSAVSKQREEFSKLISEVDASGRGEIGGTATERLRSRLAGMRDLESAVSGARAANPRYTEAEVVRSMGFSTDLAAFGASSMDELRGKIAGASNYLVEADRRAYQRILENRSSMDADYERQRNAEVRALLDSNRAVDPAGVGETASEARARAVRFESDGWREYMENLVAAERATEEFDRKVQQTIEDNQARAMFAEQQAESDARFAGLDGESADPLTDEDRRRIENFAEAQRRAQMDLRVELTATEQTMNQIADTATTGFADAMTESFLSAAKGAESFGDSFRRMAASVIESMARIAIQSALTNTIIPAFTNSVGLTASPAPRPGGPAAPTPITTYVPKSMPAMGGAAKSKAAIVVNVNNSAPGVTAQAFGSEGPSGPQIDVVVASVVSSDLDRGGPISRTLARTHGVQRKGRRG